MIVTDRERRLQIFATNYGRDAGWYVEENGRRIAQLVDAHFEDMFWDSYSIEPLVDSAEERLDLLTSSRRWLECGFAYRSRRFNMVAELAFPGGHGPKSGRILMRGLCLQIGSPSLVERFQLWWRGYREAACNA